MILATMLRQWLLEKDFEGYIQVAEAPPHPDAQEIVKKLNVDTVTNVSIRKKLGSTATGEKHFEIPPCRGLGEIFQRVLNLRQGAQDEGYPEFFFSGGSELPARSQLCPHQRLRDAKAEGMHRH